jgi:hypothetical protein
VAEKPDITSRELLAELTRRGVVHAASSANANGFFPPIGSAAGLPVSAFRFVQRIAGEWLIMTRKCLAAFRSAHAASPRRYNALAQVE